MHIETVPACPEFEILLRCAACVGEEDAAGVRALLRRGVDWQQLIRLATHHGMLPHLYTHLVDLAVEVVPAVALRDLHENFVTNARRNLHLTARLLHLLARLKEHGITAVAFKGPLLALATYGDTALRQFSDLDILVRRTDVAQARHLLVSLSYCPQFVLSERQESELIKYRNEHLFWHEAEGVNLDLHWALLPRWYETEQDTADLWDRVESMKIAGRAVTTLSAEDLILFLCVHGSKHCWHSLGMIYDLAATLRAAPTLNWELLSRLAARQGSVRMLRLGLGLAGEMFGVELPADMARQVAADPAVSRLATEVYRVLARAPDAKVGFFEEQLFTIRTLQSVRRKVLFCVDQLVTPTPLEWACLRLPPSLSFLYYLVRPCRLALKYRNGLAKPAFD